MASGNQEAFLKKAARFISSRGILVSANVIYNNEKAKIIKYNQ